MVSIFGENDEKTTEKLYDAFYPRWVVQTGGLPPSGDHRWTAPSSCSAECSSLSAGTVHNRRVDGWFPDFESRAAAVYLSNMVDPGRILLNRLYEHWKRFFFEGDACWPGSSALCEHICFHAPVRAVSGGFYSRDGRTAGL